VTAMMKAYVYHGPEKMSLDEVPKPKILKPTDAIVKVTTSTICGTDKHIATADFQRWSQAAS
jgi:alcohol dehydrogenase